LDSDTVSCVLQTDFIAYATATDTDLPEFTALSTFDRARYVEITASPVMAVWQATDHEVLTALDERRVFVEWPFGETTDSGGTYKDPEYANLVEGVRRVRSNATTRKENQKKTILLGVFIPIGALPVVIYVIYLVIRDRRRRLRTARSTPGQYQDHFLMLKPELPAESRDVSHQTPLQLEGTEICELPADSVPVREADSRPVIAEVDATAAPRLAGVTQPRVNSRGTTGSKQSGCGN
jgi:hypothetical protein